jgi:Ca-activated chloride channel family protein
MDVMNANGVAVAPTLEAGHECGVGRMLVTEKNRRVQLPLAGVRIDARVALQVARVTVEQTFHNPFTEALEAVYLFPLPGGSAVGAFEMMVGNRLVKGVVQERGEARRTYQKAMDDGKRAALLEQERDDIFTVHAGNLPPGETVSIRIAYSERLPFFEDGTTQIRLPLVVAPRYIPGTPLTREAVGDGVEVDTDQVPDASRITPPRLVRGFDPKVALSIQVEIAGGLPADLACSQHAITFSNGAVALARQDELQDRDFILRWRLGGDRVTTTLLTTKDGFGMLSLVPPRREGFLGLARDVVFVLDRSGSMSGTKMASAARACSLLLATLGPRDRFAMVAFDDRTEWFGNRTFVAADEAALAAGEKFLRGIDARGGTELDPAMKETLALIDGRAGQAGRVPVVVVLTDGQVGNEAAVFKRVQKEGGDTRIFTVGIDTAVNEAFLKRLATLGGGTSTCVVPGEGLEDALRTIGREIGAPLIVDVSLDGVTDLTPARVPDLYAGRAATVYFRLEAGKSVTVTGRYVDGKEFRQTVPPIESSLQAIGHLWAKSRVADLEDRFRLGGDQDALRKEIVALAIRHLLLTRFTAFVVVDDQETANPGGQVRKVIQPVHLPDQWEDLDAEGAGQATSCGGAPAGIVSKCLPAPASPMAKTRSASPKKLLGRKSEVCEEKAKTRERVSASEEKEFRKALEALRKALSEARAELEKGTVPSPDRIEKARKTLQKELATSALGTRLGALQRFLRSALLELVAALGLPGTTDHEVRPLFDRCEKELEESLLAGSAKEDRFWESMV